MVVVSIVILGLFFVLFGIFFAVRQKESIIQCVPLIIIPVVDTFATAILYFMGGRPVFGINAVNILLLVDLVATIAACALTAVIAGRINERRQYRKVYLAAMIAILVLLGCVYLISKVEIVLLV